MTARYLYQVVIAFLQKGFFYTLNLSWLVRYLTRHFPFDNVLPFDSTYPARTMDPAGATSITQS